VLGALGDDVLVYPGHEYTEKNLRFALEVEPDSAAVRARIERVAAVRAQGAPSVPSTLGEERASNPFLRVREPGVRAFARTRSAALDESNPSEVLAVVRRARDVF
jgi:hydroxyacylglutathione hydrolase